MPALRAASRRDTPDRAVTCAPSMVKPTWLIFYQEWLMAPGAHAAMQGSGPRPLAGLQGAQLYFIFFRSSSLTAATVFSDNGSYSSAAISKSLGGQTGTQSPQPLHLSVSMLIKNSPEPSL